MTGRAMVIAVTVLSLAAGRAGAGDHVPPYPSTLDALAPDTRREVESIWARRTLSRVTDAQPAPVPIDLYRRLIDLPEVTAAAGRHRGLAAYQVTRIGADEFAVEDDEGTRGSYRVLERDPFRRVVITRIQRRTRILGEVSGATLSRLTLIPETRDGKPVTVPRIESVVRIEHRFVAFVARVLVPLFPGYADRKIGEIFTMAAGVSAWGWAHPDEFCAWLGTQPDDARHRLTFAPILAPCRRPLPRS